MTGWPPDPVDEAEVEFWRHLETGELRTPQCRRCDARTFPPLGGCPDCGGPEADMAFTAVSGGASLYSWTTIHRPLDDEFEDEAPYTVVVVDLDEGPRMYGLLSASVTIPLAPGMRLTFRPQIFRGRAVPAFTPSS